MAKTCKNCGNELNDNVRFCPKCGTRCEMPVEVKKESQEATIETNTVENEIPVGNSQVEMKTEADNISGKKSAKWKKWVIGAAALAIIGGAIGSCGGSSYQMVEVDSGSGTAFDMTLDEFKEKYTILRNANINEFVEEGTWSGNLELSKLNEVLMENYYINMENPPYSIITNEEGGGEVLSYVYTGTPAETSPSVMTVDVDEQTGKICNVSLGSPIGGGAFVNDMRTALIKIFVEEVGGDEIDEICDKLSEGNRYYGSGMFMSLGDVATTSVFLIDSMPKEEYERKILNKN